MNNKDIIRKTIKNWWMETKTEKNSYFCFL